MTARWWSRLRRRAGAAGPGSPDGPAPSTDLQAPLATLPRRSVTLRSEPGEHLAAHLTQDGRLWFEGQDLGERPRAFFGADEYEWSHLVAAADVPRVVAALGGRPGDDVLALVAAHAAELSRGEGAWLKAHGIPAQFWSRVGD